MICEGPTDYPAIVHFFGHALYQRGIEAEFRSLFPDMDKTRPTGGWANVLLWLKNNPPRIRLNRYFGGGIFGGSLATENLDAILIHLDADILPSESFVKYVETAYGLNIVATDNSVERGNQITEVISLAAEIDCMTDVDRARHIPAPAVESTETWCIAAFTQPPVDFESLRGSQLTHHFMSALERSESREPIHQYENIDKNVERRQRFCAKHAAGSSRVVQGCPHFTNTIEKLVSINT